MENNVQKFVDLLQDDASLQEKLQAAIQNYSGEQTAEDVFQSVFQPIAEEKGLYFTLEDLQEFIIEKTDDSMMSKDELYQIAAGTGGFGATVCLAIGIGGGYHLKMKQDDSFQADNFGCCIALGFGFSAGACAIHGVEKSFE